MRLGKHFAFDRMCTRQESLYVPILKEKCGLIDFPEVILFASRASLLL